MYSTCIFCKHDLGSNREIEEIPVGRRLAFDGERGRLWVVCTRCGRWNLSPIEERWEAIEACERRFRETRLRTSTGNVGLARLGDGTDLMAANEEAERRALEGELAALEAAWREAEEIAAIADDLLLPRAVRGALVRMRR